MRSHFVLLGLVLAVRAGAAGAEEPPADPLDGKTFRSVEKLPGGERPGGGIARVHWEVRFKDKMFSWRHYDKVARGTYTFDAKTGAVSAVGGRKASFDAKAGVLTWGEHKYEMVKGGK